MIIPGILEHSFDEAKKKIKEIDSVASLIQIDIADGDLVDGKTFQNITDLNNIETNSNFELHLMVKHPYTFIEKPMPHVKKVIAHVEAKNIFEFIARAKEHNYKIGLCINVETSTQALLPYLNNIDYVQFMGVTPGGQGRTFNKDVIKKIKDFKFSNPNIKTQIDGGIGKSQLGLVLKAGVDDIVIGSAIFNSENPSETLKELQQKIEEFA